MKRRNKKRGPYMRPDSYERLKRLAERREENIGDVLDALITATINEDGNITANQVNAKIDWSGIDGS